MRSKWLTDNTDATDFIFFTDFISFGFYLVLDFLRIVFAPVRCWIAYCRRYLRQTTNKEWRPGWKPVPSVARVTRDEVSGFPWHIKQLSGRQYLLTSKASASIRYIRVRKKLSGETNTDYADSTDFIKWWVLHTERSIRVNPIYPRL